MKIFLGVIIILICGFFIITFYRGKTPATIKPPLGITFRSGFTGGVMQVHNTSSNKQMCYLTVFNDHSNQQRNFSFAIEPNGTKELGVLEMDWHFDPYEYGYIVVDGYLGKIEFKIYNTIKEYTTKWTLK